MTQANETDERFYIGPSTIPAAGEGLFARVPLDKGNRMRVVGVLVEANSVSDRCTNYADPYKLRVGDSLLIPVGWGAKVNHSDTANVRKIIEGDEVFLEALRPIAKDEELFFRYREYATSRFGLKST